MRKSSGTVLKRAIGIAATVIAGMVLTSCFTGIEGTKKINLTKSDKIQLESEPEEKYLETVVAVPLKDWQKGKRFYVTDQKLAYVMEGSPADSIRQGTILEFSGMEKKVYPGGDEGTTLVFSTGNEEIKYSVNKPLAKAGEEIMSGNLPMMIDLDMLGKTSDLLKQRPFWIKTGVWYDEAGNHVKGKKYSKIRITEVEPGNSSFPIFLHFTSEDGQKGVMMMNFGNGGNESRSFARLFSLTDIRDKYPGITDEVWNLIQQSEVRLGMTKEECRLALGTPSDTNAGHDYSRTLDIWQYPDGRYLQFADGILVNYR